VGGHVLRVREDGARDGSEPHFLCLHGLVDTLDIWDPLAAALTQYGSVLRVDQRGHGQSDAPPGPYRREDLAQDVVSLLDSRGIDRAILVGHSMGGIISMTTALAWPDRVAGLVLLGTASQCNTKTADWYERIATAGEADGNAGLARAIYGARTRKQIEGDAFGIAAVTRTLKSLSEDPLTPKLSALACRALLIVGEKDPMGPRASEIIHDAIPAGAATLQVLPGCGHWIHVEAADAVASAIGSWLAKQP
jgi:pimeloyl-ACP methyl ester carboxylesterase